MTSTNRAQLISKHLPDTAPKMLIDGEFVKASDEETRPSYDPSTGDVIAEVPIASAEDVQRAVDSAQKAQPEWESIGLDGRIKAFRKFQELILDNRERLAALDALDCGNPIKAMRTDIDISKI